MENTIEVLLIIVLVLLLINTIISLISSNKASQTTFSLLKQNNDNQMDHLTSLKETLFANNLQQEQKLELLRNSVESRLDIIQLANTKQLEEMRKTVDEKLQTTLDNKLSQSYRTVAETLDRVNKELGEMQTMVNNVGDIKKVLSNVKTRGVLGETQLSAILQEIMIKNQYDENVATVPGSTNRVEFAIKFPNGDQSVYLPIDAKFPGDSYVALQEAINTADKALIEQKKKELIAVFKKEAKDIHDKYICVPYTTDFAVMFLPTEGIYSTACNLSLIESLQRDFKVVIAGPSNMAAILNSIQMGFRTLAIQQRSSEVWQLLFSIKKEFETFEQVLESAQNKIRPSQDELEKLIGVRTRAINKQLANIQSPTNFEVIDEKENN